VTFTTVEKKWRRSSYELRRTEGFAGMKTLKTKRKMRKLTYDIDIGISKSNLNAVHFLAKEQALTFTLSIT